MLRHLGCKGFLITLILTVTTLLVSSVYAGTVTIENQRQNSGNGNGGETIAYLSSASIHKDGYTYYTIDHDCADTGKFGPGARGTFSNTGGCSPQRVVQVTGAHGKKILCGTNIHWYAMQGLLDPNVNYHFVVKYEDSPVNDWTSCWEQ